MEEEKSNPGRGKGFPKRRLKRGSGGKSKRESPWGKAEAKFSQKKIPGE